MQCSSYLDFPFEIIVGRIICNYLKVFNDFFDIFVPSFSSGQSCSYPLQGLADLEDFLELYHADRFNKRPPGWNDLD